ncbi:MAG: lamin tail domain-containing protein [Bacteroidales bacterium]
MKKLFLTLSALIAITAAQGQACSDLIISEYVEGGGNNKALEVYNTTDNSILLSDYKVCRYSNGSTTPNCVTLQDVYLEPDSVYVGVLDKRDPNGTGYDTMVAVELQEKADSFYCPVYSSNKTFYWNGNDAVSLEYTDGTLVDLMGEVGVDPGLSWTMDSSANYTDALGGAWWTRNHTLVRKQEVTEGVTTNPSPFIVANEWDSLPYNTFDHLGWHECACHNGTGVKEQENAENMFVYPNPVVNNEVVIKSTKEIEEITIIDMLGKAVISRNFEAKTSTAHFDELNLKTGIYLLNVQLVDGNKLTKKIYVQ